MSVAAVANKEDKKPLYKDYVSFLGSYKQGKKDEVGEDQCSPSSSVSSSNSSASITSDADDMPKKSFREYLENYNNKKFNPVQADFKKIPSQNSEGKMVKTEVFIDINNDVNSSRLISKTIDLNIEPHKDISSGKKVIPESQETINTPAFHLKTNNELGQIKLTVEGISQRKMDNNIPSTEIKKHPLKKTSSGIDTSSSASEKRVTTESQENINTPAFQLKTNNELGQIKLIVEEISQRQVDNSIPLTEIKIHPLKKTSIGIDTSSGGSEKKVIPESHENVNVPVFQLKTNNESGQIKLIVEEISQRQVDNNVPSTEIKRHPLKKTSSITEKSKIFEKISTKNKTNCRSEAVCLPARNGCLPPKPVLHHKSMSPEALKNSFIKPKLAKTSADLSTTSIQHNNTQTGIVSPEKSTTDSPISATAIPCSTSPLKNISCGIPPPPPPPLPQAVNNFSPKKLSVSPKPNFISKAQPNYNTMPKLQNTRQVDTMDGFAPPALDKNDPRMKKMVYGALREMYGAYHDKANDYLATLPKNRVKKNNGLDSIINSIASQGGLEKLTGRGNPKVEAE